MSISDKFTPVDKKYKSNAIDVETIPVEKEFIEENLEDNTIEEVIEDEKAIEISQPTEDYIKEAFDTYDLSNEDGVIMLDLIDQYQKSGSPKGMYDKLPDSMKSIIDGMVAGMEIPKGQTIAHLKNSAVGFVFDELLQDAKVSEAFDSYKADMEAAVAEIDTGYAQLFHDAFEDTFDKIDEIRAENPEQADTILKVKNAFEAAYDFSYYIDWLDVIGPNKLTKWANRFDSDALYFNNRLNSTFLNNVPSIKDLIAPIKANLPVEEYTDMDIIKFLSMVCHRSIKEDINDIAVIAYYYRFVTDIYSYTFTISSALDERGTKIFNGIKEVIDKIKSL